MRDALVQALVWDRPALELRKGIIWPYRALSQRAHGFESMALAPNPSVGKSARLFLALLPFPDQWKWLNRAMGELHKEPEIIELKNHEQETIANKIAKKRSKSLKLRNFCQVLKRPALPGEKGVLRIFSLPYLFSIPELLRRLDREYILYIEPAAGVVFRHTWMRIFSTLKDPVLFGLASLEDASFVGGQAGTAVTQLAHGDYLDLDAAMPPEALKTYDMVFNGTFDEMERKRHRLMLELMTHPLLANTTTLFLGRGKESNVAELRRQAGEKGLEKRVTIISNIRRNRVPDHLARARIGVHLALHENGCRAVYEYFRSNLPCAVSSCTAGINFSIINPRTGSVGADKELPAMIRRTLDARKQFTPRQWLRENSGSILSSFNLNNCLKELFSERNYSWSNDIVPLSSSGANRYLKESHYAEFRPEFHRLKELFDSIPSLPLKISDD